MNSMELIQQLKIIKETVEKNRDTLTKEELLKRIDEMIGLVYEYFEKKKHEKLVNKE